MQRPTPLGNSEEGSNGIKLGSRARTCLELCSWTWPTEKPTDHQTPDHCSCFCLVPDVHTPCLSYKCAGIGTRTVRFHDHGLHTNVMPVDACSISHLPDRALVRSNILCGRGQVFWCNIFHSRWFCTNCCMHLASFQSLATHEPDTRYQDILHSLYISFIDIRMKHVLTAVKVFHDCIGFICWRCCRFALETYLP